MPDQKGAWASGAVLTPAEVAERLKVSKFTVYELIKRGQLPAFHVGRQVRVTEEALVAYAARAIRPAARPTPDEPPFVFIGSHDLAVAHLLDICAERNGTALPVRHYAGSLAGLMALERREAHVAGSHLYDEDTAEYNRPYVSRVMPGEDVVLVGLAYRTQGLIVAAGNPLGLHGWEDLARPGLRMVNRQRGAGTRVLLDQSLRALGLDAKRIAGYENEVATHGEAAEAVANGLAETAVGIEAAARAQGLGFVPLTHERYDLVMLGEEDVGRRLAPLLATLNSPSFQRYLAGLPGYDASCAGQVVRLPLNGR